MLLTETIKKSTSSIIQRRAAIEHKQSAEAYAAALVKLSRVTESIRGTLECATAMKGEGIVSTPLMDEPTRSDLLACINGCGFGVDNMQLTPEAVELLRIKGEAVATQVTIVWHDAAQKYGEAAQGYLSMIGGLSSNPQRAKELTDSITQTAAGKPSVKASKALVCAVEEAKQLTAKFALNPEIESFLQKVSSRNATVFDLTPNVLAWLDGKGLKGKLKIRF